MSEHEGGESRTAVAFFLGFLLGVLVGLGGAGSYFLIHLRRARAEAEAARAAELEARRHAEENFWQALAELDKALRDAQTLKARKARKWAEANWGKDGRRDELEKAIREFEKELKKGEK
jgi:hypothetical protein